MSTPRVLVVQHEAGCTPAWLGEWLLTEGCIVDVRHPYAGPDLPPDLAEHDVLLVLGGSMGANDDAEHPWLRDTKALVRDAAERQVPTLGVCLGHQICAVALGGEAGRNPAGRRLGLVPVAWLPEAESDPLVGSLTSARVGLHWNDDVVTTLPPGSTLLATTPTGEPEVVRFAPSVWGVQLHPEADDRVLAAWGREDAERAGRSDPEVLAAIEDVAPVRAELERSWRPLARHLVELAR